MLCSSLYAILLFLPTADVPEVYMHQLWDTIHKYDTSYRVYGQNFDEFPTDEVIVSFFKELGHTGEIKSITDKSLDKLRLSRAQILWGMYYKKNVDYVELLWEDFTYQIDNKAYKKQEKMYYPRFTKVIIHYFLTKDKTISWRNKIGMHTSRDDYLINTLRFVSANEVSQIYEARLPKSMTSPEMRETKAYNTFIGYATGAIPPKIARKFKKSSPTKKDINLNLVPMDENPVKEELNEGKRLQEVHTTRHLSFARKSLRDFHRTHPSGSGAAKDQNLLDKDDSNIDHDSSSEGSDQENDSGDDNTQIFFSDNEKGSDSKHETDENEDEVKDDEEENEDKFVRTTSYYSRTGDEDETNVESKGEDKGEGDEDERIDYTTSQLYDDVDIRLNKPVQAVDLMPVHKITLDQVVEDAHVTISTVAKKTEVPVTSSSHSSNLAAKFLNFADIPTTEAEIVSPIDVPVYHEVPSGQTPTLLTLPVLVITESLLVYTTNIPHSLQSFTPPPPLSTPHHHQQLKQQILNLHFLISSVFQFNNRVSALEKEVSELRMDDPLNTQVTALVDEHLESRLGATKDEFMNYLLASITARITEQVKI
ncbi:hypothetical protein Tco_0965511 [Tanacetum coccineum]